MFLLILQLQQMNLRFRKIASVYAKYQKHSLNHYMKTIPILQSKPNLCLHIVYKFVNIPIDSKYYQSQFPIKINQILQMLTAEKKLNEKGIILQHLAETICNDPRIILSRDQIVSINKQIQQWKGRKGRSEKVATIAWVINKLNLYKYHQDLYDQIAQRLSNDEWYVNFDESLKALQAFTSLQNQELKEYIYPRIQRNIDITVWEFNMIYYQRITMALLQGGRYQSKLWDKLEDHILKNLGMDYSLKTITDIFTSYALAGRGTDVFYQMIQKAICLGHWYNYDFKHKILPGYDQNGEFYALLVQTYSITKANCNIHLLPQFLDYIFSGISDRKTNYHKLQSFTRIIKFLPGLFVKEQQDQIITNLLQNKKPTSISVQQIFQFYDMMKLKDIKIPLHLHRHIEKVLLSDINRKLIPTSKVIEITQELMEKDYILEPEQFEQAVRNSIVNGFKYLEAEEAKAVLQLSSKCKFLPNHTKQILKLPVS